MSEDSNYTKEQALQEEIKALLKDTIETPKVADLTDSNTSEVASNPETTESQNELVYQPKDEWEEKAIKLGWDPNHRNETFVDAKEYVLRKPLFERIERQGRELRDYKDRQNQIEQNLANIRREAYNQALRDIETRRETAVQEADIEQYRRLQQDDARLRTQMGQDPVLNVPIEQPQIDQNVKEFAEKHSWLVQPKNQTEAKMKAAAEAVDAFLYKQAKIDQGLDPNNFNHVPKIDNKAHLQAVEAEVRRLFPQNFSNTQSTRISAPTVGKSTAGGSLKSSSSNLTARMTEQQRSIAEQFVKQSIGKDGKPMFTVEDYAKELDKYGRLK